MTKHHIICSSRGGGDDRDNIVRVNEKKHNLFHALFGNMLPGEVIKYIVITFFRGNWKYVEEALHDYWREMDN